MAGGLFELRRDDITGWWVAVVVDREFNRARFAREAAAVSDSSRRCGNCDPGPNDRTRVRVLKPRAFMVAGSELDRRRREEGKEPPGEDAGLRMGLLGDIGSWETIVAPFEHHVPLSRERQAVVIEMLRLARDRIVQAREEGGTQYVQIVQNWGKQAGAMTDHLCFDVYDLPHLPHRIGEELGGAARYVIREGICPWCRLVEDEVARRDRLVFEDAASVCFAPYASRSPFELWVVPRHHEADFGLATDEQLTGAAGALQKVIRLLDQLDGPPYNLVLHTAPLHESVDETYHWHWEIHPRLRDIAGLELGSGLPVNPISPEGAVDELLASTREASGESAPHDDPSSGRSWNEFRR
jgi:UDPglucose--hexose-1-phosphate uridylyltransferase